MSNFVCPHCGMVNIDCGSEGYKTPREIELENIISEIKEICIKDVYTFADGTELRYDSLDDILDIISKAKDKKNANQRKKTKTRR